MTDRNINNRDIQLQNIMTTAKSELPQLLAVSDSKSLFDNMVREQFTAAEKRAALEIAVIRDSLRSLGGSARWVPHELNCSDCLTKKKGNSQSLLQLLHSGRYRLIIEEQELQRRKEERALTGKRNARPKRMTLDDDDDGRVKDDSRGRHKPRAKVRGSSSPVQTDP